MSLFGTIYVSKSGVNSMAQGISVTADNIANLNSTGFRCSQPLFEDLLLSSASEAPPYDQKGLGVGLESIETLYKEGPIEATDQPSDMAIVGKGFFTVTDGDHYFYTRDGGFILREAEEGYMRISTPSGYDLCGWACPEGEDPTSIDSGILAPITIPTNVSGSATSNITLQINCDASQPVETSNVSLLDNWNPSFSEPLISGFYEFKLDVPIWDNAGTQHDISIYFDNTAESQVFEFLIAVDPSEDWRGDGPLSGCLLSGELRFNDSGQISSIDNLKIINPDGEQEDVNPSDLSNGLPTFTVNFTGNPQDISLDFGIVYNQEHGAWEPIEGRNSTAYASPFSVLYQYIDGYPPGAFENIDVTPEGVIEARYSNNQIFNIARIPLALFGSPDELERIGGSLFKSVNGAEPEYYPPGYDVPGIILGGALEGSNVDLANEMIHLITLQRAFQSNARVISTADQLLENFIQSI